MSRIALYTFGLLDPAAETGSLADFSRRGGEIFSASDHAPGFLGRAEQTPEDYSKRLTGDDFGRWGSYVLPMNLPGLEDHDLQLHIATLSLWRDVESARAFVYQGLHRDALTMRYDWFLRGPWPGHVLWRVDDGVLPLWSDGVSKLEALASEGESVDRFTFGSR